MGRIRGGALRIIHCRSDCGDADPLLCDELKSTSLNPSLSTFIPEAVGSRPKTRDVTFRLFSSKTSLCSVGQLPVQPCSGVPPGCRAVPAELTSV